MTDLRDQLRRLGQGHVLQRLDELSETGAAEFLTPLQGLDLQALHRAASSPVEEASAPLGVEDVRPPDMVTAPSPLASTSPAAALHAGEELLAQGHVGILIVAGGMGTRLGWNGPKGTYPIGPVSERSLFELFFTTIAAIGKIHGVIPPLAIQTSPSNDAETRDFLTRHDHFGLPAASVRTFAQGTLPAWTLDGRLATQPSGDLVSLPDGHGGVYEAFSRHGIGGWMRSLGVKHVFYFQVDNALVPMADPAFLGHHALAGSEMSTMVVEKRRPDERVGVLAHVGEALRVIEYSEISEALSAARSPEGPLLLRAANTGTHAFTLDFLERMGSGALLPLHTARKPVPQGDDMVDGVKMERFVFDALPVARHALVYDAPRADVFAPVKSATGDDTPEAAREAMMALYRRKVREVGAAISREDALELSPRALSDPATLQSAIDAWTPGQPLMG